MALSRVKTWTSETLTSSDLNAEFNNILNNALSLISPLTSDLAAGGNKITGLALGSASAASLSFTSSDTDTGIYSSAANTVDITAGGVRAASFGTTASAVNYLAITPSATTTSLKLTATGTDTNIDIELVPKGTGGLLNAVGAVATPSYSFTGDTNTGMYRSAADTVAFAIAGANVFNLSTSTVTFARIVSADAGAQGPRLRMHHNSASPADSDTNGTIDFTANDDGATERIVAQINSVFEDVTSTTMDSRMGFAVMNAVNAGNAATTATLTSLGVWTDASAAAGKEYEGELTDVFGKARQLTTMGVYRGKHVPAEKLVGAERHYSPTAEDFWQCFGLGRNPAKGDPGIAPKDVAWIAVKMALELDDRLKVLEAA